MKRQIEDYIVKGVGNYQICVKHPTEDKYIVIMPLSYIQQDNIIYSKNGKFLVLRHATLGIADIYELFKREGVKADINANHKILDLDTNKTYTAESKFTNAELRYIRLEQDCESFGGYKLVFKLNNVDMLYAKEEVDNE